jgi:diguanylate cyclase (GGDEF)-like protein
MTADPTAAPSDPSGAERLAALTAEVESLRAEVARLRALADHDTLTPLLNRRAFMRELGRAMAFCRRYGAPAAVLYLDLDGFKAVNDAYGHLAGDAALRRVADLLAAHIRESDAAARLGGDEFAVLLVQADAAVARAKADALAALIAAEPFAWEGERFSLGASFGVRVFEDQSGPDAWLAEADAAMFVRKRSSR